MNDVIHERKHVRFIEKKKKGSRSRQQCYRPAKNLVFRKIRLSKIDPVATPRTSPMRQRGTLRPRSCVTFSRHVPRTPGQSHILFKGQGREMTRSSNITTKIYFWMRPVLLVPDARLHVLRSMHAQTIGSRKFTIAVEVIQG
jgi:hypothetical protein